MLKKILFISFCCVLFTGAAFAEQGSAYQFNAAWGNGGTDFIKTCGVTNIPESACIGASTKNGCKTDYTKYKDVINARDYKDEYAILMMVARKINEYCAYFCPTQIEAKNRNRRDAWTEYADASKGDNDCVWLCRGGNWSEVYNNPDFCESRPLEQKNYKDIGGIPDGSNIENSIPRFLQSQDAECGSNTDQEHDIILAITKYLSNGHGAYVRQLVVRADKNGWEEMTSYPSVYPAVKFDRSLCKNRFADKTCFGDEEAPEILVCRPGYKPSGDDCVEAVVGNCTEQEKDTELCEGWEEGYDANIHDLVRPAGRNCYEFRCTEGKGFEVGTKNCVQVNTEGLREGVDEATGEIIECASDEMFDTVSDACKQYTKLSRQTLQFGPEKSKNTVLDEQCWTMDQYDYENCVLGKSK